jgi:hypothetical protein
MLGQDRCAGKRLEESDMPSNVNTQIDGDRLVQTVVCRGEPSGDRGGRGPIDGDLRKRQVDSFGPCGLRMHEPHDTVAINEKTHGLRAPADPQQQLL